MNNRHTASRIFELQSQQGREPTVVPGAGTTKVQFMMSALPTQKDSKFWYYVEAIWLKLVIKLVLPADSLFAGFHPAYFWQALATCQATTPILGTLFDTNNTRGSVLGNLLQKIGFGYGDLPTPNLLGAGGDGDVYVNLFYRLPLANNFLQNRMDTAPWSGFLEGGLLTLNIAPRDVFAKIFAGNIMTEVKVSAFMALQPEPEARIHTPFNWREHTAAGSSNKFVIPDMGSPDGLQGIDQSRGAGLAHLSLLVGPTGNNDKLGLDPGTTAANILAYSIPWRDQPQVENPECAIINQYESQGIVNRKTGAINALSDMDFPQLTGTTVPDGNTSNLLTNSLIFPLVSTGSDVMTSKLQTVAGAKESNFQFTAKPTIDQRFLGGYALVFDSQFEQELVQRIMPGAKGDLSPKTSNKQKGGVRNIGKLAYVPAKVEA